MNKVTQLTVLPLAGHASALVVLAKPMPAACCDGRMVVFLVNAGGETKCVMCAGNPKEQR